MCGLAGLIGFRALEFEPGVIVEAMGQAIVHRGPDDSGIWIDHDAEVALVHRRLSIVDLSPAGHQPMHSASGRYVIVFNGEIYNFQAIRTSLEREGLAPAWRGHSDTEVLLAAVSAWGLRRTLEQAVGMFAIALLDRKTRQLQLARDRLGEKPLYYGNIGNSFVFASELKALTCHPAWQGEVDRGALAAFMRFNNVPAPLSIYRGVRKLAAGCVLTRDLGTGRETIETYWSAEAAFSTGSAHRFAGTPDEAAAKVEALLKQAIAGQMMADVPVGAFLSGGIDSSTVVALMQSMATRPVRTFSIGFDVHGYDEAAHAKAVARHLGTDHTELYLTEKDALETVPRLPEIYCEPFADSSAIPTSLLSALARRHVTVSLSGDGGDEVFGGYVRHGLGYGPWRYLARTPVSVRRVASSLLGLVPPGAWEAIGRMTGRSRLADKIHKAASVMTAAGDGELYTHLVSHWMNPERVVLGAAEPPLEGLRTQPTSMRSMMLSDLVSYLPNDVLVKVDRAAMASSLETRVPMLDHRLIEFSATLPDAILRHQGRSKWPLRRVLSRYVPPDLVERPKAGFAVPLDAWLRGALRDWAEDLLSEARLAEDGLFDVVSIRRAWSDNVSGRRNLQHQLWCVLMFQSWRRRYAARGQA